MNYVLWNTEHSGAKGGGKQTCLYKGNRAHTPLRNSDVHIKSC